MLRGANLGGSSKIPLSPNLSHITDETEFYNHREVSFVGRPFPLEEADEHFARLRQWGLTFLRFVVTWEAIEHAGPGIYDEAYLDYLYQVVHKAHTHGLQMFIDPHQDAWSRLSGGDGAPGWTFEAVGFDVTRFRETGAANIHPFDEEPFVVHWLTNYTRLAAATMFTLFFGGDDFAPRTTIAGEPVQSFLQRHYFDAVKQVAHTLQGLPNVVGFETMNEPSSGFIGRKVYAHNEELYLRRLGVSPTPYQAMLLGAGYPQEVDVWKIGIKGFRPDSKKKLLNREGARVWQEGHECIWREHGVWDIDSQGQPCLLSPHYFTHVMRNGQPTRINFGRDYLLPFVNRFASEVRSVKPSSIIFVETIPRQDMPRWETGDAPGVVNASHWYDVMTLFLRVFIPFLNLDIKAGRLIFGSERVQSMFVEQLAWLKHASKHHMGDAPTLVGEFGTSFNMPFQLNYRLNWFTMQEWALDASFQALDANLLNATIWNYTADNTNGKGDRWNTEDLSIFSRDQQRNHHDDKINSGGRALRAVVRPYPARTAGEPLHMSFNLRRRIFRYTFRHDPTVQTPTELYIPALHYPQGYDVEVSDGMYEQDYDNQLLRYWHSLDRETHEIEVRYVKGQSTLRSAGYQAPIVRGVVHPATEEVELEAESTTD
jgi:hypothetical protein